METHYNDLLHAADCCSEEIEYYANELEYALLRSHKADLQKQLRIRNSSMRRICRQIQWEDAKMLIRMFFFNLPRRISYALRHRRA